uniref:Uncharacterized protein n=1 Tax=Anopheles albimanus TaxID=7167 RepID=A0A182FZ07_ANOAL
MKANGRTPRARVIQDDLCFACFSCSRIIVPSSFVCVCFFYCFPCCQQ